ncbi:MAG: hypothetical protein SH856_00155 [Flavobacteriales bacterium]|nr:hypothetical protein [Flavobacteriales bacterium]
MSKKFHLIYLLIAPLLWAFSWFVSQRVVPRAQAIGTGEIEAVDPKMSWMYASILTGVYLLGWFVIRDLYRKKK